MFIEKVRDDLWRIVWSSAGYTGPEYFSTRKDAVNFGATLLQVGGDVDKATDMHPVCIYGLANVEKSSGRGIVKKTTIVFCSE
jgi:hypothetical protein